MQLPPWLACGTPKLQLSAVALVRAVWDLPFICSTSEGDCNAVEVCARN